VLMFGFVLPVIEPVQGVWQSLTPLRTTMRAKVCTINLKPGTPLLVPDCTAVLVEKYVAVFVTNIAQCLCLQTIPASLVESTPHRCLGFSYHQIYVVVLRPA